MREKCDGACKQRKGACILRSFAAVPHFHAGSCWRALVVIGISVERTCLLRIPATITIAFCRKNWITRLWPSPSACPHRPPADSEPDEWQMAYRSEERRLGKEGRS